MNDNKRYNPYYQEPDTQRPYAQERFANQRAHQPNQAYANNLGNEQPYVNGYDAQANDQQPYAATYQQGMYEEPNQTHHAYQQGMNDPYQTYTQEEQQYHYDPRYDERQGYVNASGQPPEEEKKKKHRFLFWLFFLVALCVFLYSAFQLFTILKQNWDEKRELENITEIANIPEDPETAFAINWEELRKVNDHVVGWILIPDTNISYPIVQGTDNSYYLDHTFAKESNYAGAIFVDYHNKPDFSDNNTFVYGHNVKHGTMFAELEKFLDQSFFDEHKYVYLFTPNQNYKCEVLSFHSVLDGSESYQFGISDVTAWKNYINIVTSTDLPGHVRQDVEMGESDRMISLSTCSYEVNDAPSDHRYLLHAKLVPWIGQYTEKSAESDGSSQ